MTFAVALADLSFFGQDLARPECVVATARGDVFASDHRGGIARVHAERPAALIRARGVQDFLPNGFALLPDRSFMIANLGPAGGVYRMAPDGTLSAEVVEVDGVTLPPTNFANAEHSTGALRVWVSVSTRQVPREQAMRFDVADGTIVLKDARGTRIVAVGLGFTNENKLDPSGRWLYVNETMARRLSRFVLQGDGLGPRETVAEFGDGDPEAIARAERNFAAHRLTRADIDAGRHGVLGNLASVTFGGPDLKTVFLGSLFAPRIATFRSPIAGAPPPHWGY